MGRVDLEGTLELIVLKPLSRNGPLQTEKQSTPKSTTNCRLQDGNNCRRPIRALNNSYME